MSGYGGSAPVAVPLDSKGELPENKFGCEASRGRRMCLRRCWSIGSTSRKETRPLTILDIKAGKPLVERA